MDVQGVNTGIASYLNKNTVEQKPANSNAAATGAAAANTSAAGAANEKLEGVEFVKSEDTKKPVTYDKAATLEYIRQSEEARMQNFNNMITKMLVKQGETSNLTLNNMKLFVSEADAAKAAKAIAPGGEYSVDAVAGRILDMAKALSGGDPSKISLLKNAVKKGFKDAEEAWGGKMPSITDETYNKVMKGFDEWEASSKGVTSTQN